MQAQLNAPFGFQGGFAAKGGLGGSPVGFGVGGFQGEFLGIRGDPQFVRECCNATGGRVHRVAPHSQAKPR